jgi:glycosyltransferase involved in cell wall biosynthesis
MRDGRESRRARLCMVAAAPLTLKVFMRPHVQRLGRDYDVSLVANGSMSEMAAAFGADVAFTPLRIERKISIVPDARALIALWRLFRHEQFDAVHSISPKAGLLAMVAARLAGVPVRVHIFTGQVWATARGPRRFLLKSLDKLLASNATRLLADSASQRAFLVANGVAGGRSIDVLADGSVAGVDLQRFTFRTTVRDRVRAQHGIPADAVVFLFLGRLNRDKGLLDLSLAFAAVAERDARSQLLVVGPDEEGLETEFADLGRRYPGRVHRIGFAGNVEEYMSAADVFCLPSYREGFGSAIIEAAAVGLPAIASRIYGITDAVEAGVTGILHLPGSDAEIADAMLRLATHQDLRRRMGEAARDRVKAKFSEARLTEAMADFYRDRFSAIGTRHAEATASGG